jgi:hypothetical protein
MSTIALANYIFWRTGRLVIVLGAGMVMIAAAAVSLSLSVAAWPFERVQRATAKFLHGLTS